MRTYFVIEQGEFCYWCAGLHPLIDSYSWSRFDKYEYGTKADAQFVVNYNVLIKHKEGKFRIVEVKEKVT